MIEDEERKRERYHPLHHPVLGRLCLRSAISQSGAPPLAHWRPLSTAAADDEVELQGETKGQRSETRAETSRL